MNDSSISSEFVITALGASAGGLEALEKFFKHMPSDAGIGFIVVQHLAPDHDSALSELLGRYTRMPVQQARDRVPVAPNRVYIIPPNVTLTIENRVLYVSPPMEARGLRTPIDSLFRSLAEDCGENAVCIMLSGTGTDGTLGLKAIKEYGGMAMAQTLESAKYDSILRSAISTGLVDHVLPVEEMPVKLLEYSEHVLAVNGNSRNIHDELGTHWAKIHSLLQRRVGHDFSQYKENTIARRLSRRMKALQIDTVEKYVGALEQQPEEVDRLFKDLLIGVTHFFRDAEAFETLARDVVPKLFEGKGREDQLRACVVGCASGEEAYSLAITLCEHASTIDNAATIKVFATDIDERGLETARKGLYPESIAEHVSPERLERFFDRRENAYQTKRSLRELCIFTNHSFIKDPPFARQDLISCRNVMIYLGVDLQHKIVPLFHYALRPAGYLFLGPSESASSHRELFRTVNNKHRIFQRKETVPRRLATFPLAESGNSKHSDAIPAGMKEQNLSKQLDRIIAQRYRPACAAVQENGNAVYFSGGIGRYFEQPSGSPSTNLIAMAKEGLRIPLQTALQRATTSRQTVVQRQIPIKTDKRGANYVDLTIEPLEEFQAANLYMVVLEDVVPAKSGRKTDPALNRQAEETIRHLENELRAAQEHSQAVFEELESSNEELKSANEEYQSTNEELETSKEEIQSVNEELETVNTELNRRIAELDSTNSDLQNLNASTQIATIFLDRQLRIKNFTPAAGTVFHLIASDVGRPITDLAALFEIGGFLHDLQEVVRTLVPRQRDLPGTQGEHYLMRIHPYRTVHDRIEGVVVTLTNITELTKARRSAEDAKTLAENVVNTVRQPLIVLTADLRVQAANMSFYELFQVSPEQTLGKSIFELGDRQWDISELARLLGEVLPEKKALQDFPVEHTFPNIGKKIMLLTASQIHQESGNARLILLAIEDITERKRVEEAMITLKDEIATELKGMRRLHEISSRLVGHGNLQALLEEILVAAIDLSGAAFGNIQVLVPSGTAAERLRIIAQRGFQREFVDFFNSSPENTGACGRALQTGERVVIGDVANDPLFRGTPAGEVMLKAGALAVQSTPLRSRSGKLLGILSTHYPSAHAIDGRVLQWIDLLARHAADLIERDQAEDALHKSEERLFRAIQHLQSIGVLLIEGGSSETIDDKIVETAVAIMHSDMASLQAYDEDQDALRLLAWKGFGPEFGKVFERCEREREAACGAALRGGRVIVADVENSEFITNTAALEDHRKMGIRAVQSTPLLSRSGRLLGMISTYWRTPLTPRESDLNLFDLLARQAADIIEHKQAQEARGRLVALVQSSADAIVSQDLDGIILSWNSGAENVFGYMAQEAIGRSISMLVAPGQGDEQKEILARIRRGERIENYDTIRRRKDGTFIDVSLTVSPILDDQGRIVAAAKIARDITERKRTEQERRHMDERERRFAIATALRESEAELARVTRALTIGELATSIAHEVNQPLAAIVTNAAAGLRWLNLNEPKISEAQQSLDLIVRDGNRASEVVRRIRDFLKKDNQQIEVLDINQVIQEAVSLVRDELLKREITLRVELSGYLPPVQGDRVQLQQVILNLMMNGSEAVKSGSEELHAVLVISSKSEENSVLVAVQDSGVGIDPEKMDRMFDAFFTTKPGGIGMGLSISRTIIEAHAGRIWATPNEGPGLTVQFTLPTGIENTQ